MGLGLKDKQDLDRWRLGLRVKEKALPGKGAVWAKGIMEKIQGQPGGMREKVGNAIYWCLL